MTKTQGPFSNLYMEITFSIFKEAHISGRILTLGGPSPESTIALKHPKTETPHKIPLGLPLFMATTVPHIYPLPELYM